MLSLVCVDLLVVALSSVLLQSTSAAVCSVQKQTLHTGAHDRTALYTQLSVR
jgi:hypothetical protein